MATLGRSPGAAPLTSADIPDDSITTAKIVDATIAAGDLAPNSVDSSELVDGSIDISHFSASGTKDTTTYLRGDNSFQTAGATSGIANTNHLAANANVADNDFLRVDGTSIEGRTAAEVLSDISAIGASNPTVTLGSNATFPTGHVVQVAYMEDDAVDTGTTTFVDDDTIPQITEGNEFMTLAITPKSATNKLMVEVIHNLIGSYAGGQAMVGAVFNTDFHATNALACSWAGVMNSYASNTVLIRFYVVSGTTSATTFRFRGASCSAGTTTFNGRASARKFGGALLSSMTITEVIPPA